MSRHLYDIEKLMDTDFAKEALTNESFYKEVIAHRRKFIGLKEFDYLDYDYEKSSIQTTYLPTY